MTPFAALGELEKSGAMEKQALTGLLARGGGSILKSLVGAAKGLNAGGGVRNALGSAARGWSSGAKGLSSGGRTARHLMLGGGAAGVGAGSIHARGGDLGLAEDQMRHMALTPLALPGRIWNASVSEQQQMKPSFLSDLLGVTGGPKGSEGILGGPKHGLGFDSPRVNGQRYDAKPMGFPTYAEARNMSRAEFDARMQQYKLKPGEKSGRGLVPRNTQRYDAMPMGF